MAGLLHSRFRILLAAAVAATAAALLLPGTAIDRLVFTAAVRSVANPPFFVSGGGKPDNPWQLRVVSARKPSDTEEPVVVALEDDPDGFFQSFPQAPIDLAVILKNFQRLGGNKAAVAVVLAWDEPDPIGLAALDKVLGGFESLVMCAPLGRGAVPEPLPAPFRSASLAVADIDGALALPVVNRIPLTGVILGESAAAGFQTLESEPATDAIPLLARWDDRVVLAFPLLAAMQRLDVPVDQLEVRLGKYIRLGKEGPVLPIDARGYFPSSSIRHLEAAAVPARDVIDRGEPLVSTGDPVLLRDDRGIADDHTRRFSASLVPAIATLATREGLSEITRYPRLGTGAEWTWLAVVVVAASLAVWSGGMARAVLLSVLASAIVIAQLLGFGLFDCWLPGLPALVATAAAGLVCLVPIRVVEKPGNQPKTARKPAAKKTSRKTAAKKSTAAPAKPKEPAKKAPARKTPAKKTARKQRTNKKATPRKRRK